MEVTQNPVADSARKTPNAPRAWHRRQRLRLPRRIGAYYVKDLALGAALLMPTFLILGFVLVGPIIRIVHQSFFNVSLLRLSEGEWVGLGNFQRLLNDDVFWDSLLTTFWWTVGNVAIGSFIGFVLALALNRPFWGRNVVRAFVILPWAMPPVVVGMIFIFVLNIQVGVVNFVLVRVGVLSEAVAWFSAVGTALPAVMLSAIWRQVPFHVLVYLAGLQGVDEDLIQAAHVDGAGAWDRLRYVVLPHMTPYIILTGVLMTMWNFNNFDLIWSTTMGGPVRATNILSVEVFETMFRALDVGYASAIGVAWFLILLPLGTLGVIALERRTR